MSKRVVVIGGGTGSFSVLKGLKEYDADITAVVSMFDSGGSTGLLRDEFGMLPPGDVRRCLLALADEQGASTMRELFNFRFDKESSLQGHNFGNLLLTALTQIVGNEVEAIREAAKVLNIKGKVLPVSTDKSHLCARLHNGTVIEGETNIDIPKHDGNIPITQIFLKPEATIYQETKEAILEADLIVIGPGDLYTSILPNLIVNGMKETIHKTKAKIAYVCNIMTKWGETNGFNASQHAFTILESLKLPQFDYIICNKKKASNEILQSYASEKAFPVDIDIAISDLSKEIIIKELMKESDIARHDSEKLASTLIKL